MLVPGDAPLTRTGRAMVVPGCLGDVQELRPHRGSRRERQAAYVGLLLEHRVRSLGGEAQLRTTRERRKVVGGPQILQRREEHDDNAVADDEDLHDRHRWGIENAARRVLGDEDGGRQDGHHKNTDVHRREGQPKRHDCLQRVPRLLLHEVDLVPELHHVQRSDGDSDSAERVQEHVDLEGNASSVAVRVKGVQDHEDAVEHQAAAHLHAGAAEHELQEADALAALLLGQRPQDAQAIGENEEANDGDAQVVGHVDPSGRAVLGNGVLDELLAAPVAIQRVGDIAGMLHAVVAGAR
eukprot:scaffold1712_cov261-Pinguiococcus_pyrenoidosus.AAC.13